jgi:hypothetical protein
MRFLQLFLVLAPCYWFSQSESVVQYSRLEKMIMQPGSFVRIDTDTLGFSGNLGIGAITSVGMNDNKKQRPVCFIAGNSYSSIAFSPANLQIDIEELTPFINALKVMRSAIDSKSITELQTDQYTSSNLTVLRMKNRLGNKAKWDITISKNINSLMQWFPGLLFLLREKISVS